RPVRCAPAAKGPSSSTPNQVPNSLATLMARHTRESGARRTIFFSMRSVVLVIVQPPGCATDSATTKEAQPFGCGRRGVAPTYSSTTPACCVTHMLVPSNAIPSGAVTTANVPSLAPLGDSLVTALPSSSVIHMLVPSNAIPDATAGPPSVPAGK